MQPGWIDETHDDTSKTLVLKTDSRWCCATTRTIADGYFGALKRGEGKGVFSDLLICSLARFLAFLALFCISLDGPAFSVYFVLLFFFCYFCGFPSGCLGILYGFMCGSFFYIFVFCCLGFFFSVSALCP